MVLTTKHHDGFCLFDSKLTAYTIMNSPFHRDVTKELSDAVRKARLRWGEYFTGPDWHYPDYDTENHAKFVEHFRGQVALGSAPRL